MIGKQTRCCFLSSRVLSCWFCWLLGAIAVVLQNTVYGCICILVSVSDYFFAWHLLTILLFLWRSYSFQFLNPSASCFEDVIFTRVCAVSFFRPVKLKDTHYGDGVSVEALCWLALVENIWSSKIFPKESNHLNMWISEEAK